MDWYEATKEYKKINEELVSGLTRLIDDNLINRIVTIKGKVDRATIDSQHDQIRDLQLLVENIGKTIGIKFNRLHNYDSAINRKKVEEEILNQIRNELSSGIKLASEPQLVITIGGEYSLTFKVDKKDYKIYENCKRCYEFEDDDENYEEFMEYVKDSDLIMSEYFNRNPNSKMELVNIKDINKFFKEIINDTGVSVNIFAKMIETIIPVRRESHNSVAWL